MGGEKVSVVKVSAGSREAAPGQDKSSQAPETSRTYLHSLLLWYARVADAAQ